MGCKERSPVESGVMITHEKWWLSLLHWSYCLSTQSAVRHWASRGLLRAEHPWPPIIAHSCYLPPHQIPVNVCLCLQHSFPSGHMPLLTSSVNGYIQDNPACQKPQHMCLECSRIMVRPHVVVHVFSFSI